MKFFNQLRILLWKNATLKRRNLGLTLMELIIPLLLMIILMALRSSVPATRRDPVSYDAQPLPSAGIVPMLQSLCPGGVTNEDGFRDQPRSPIDLTFGLLNAFTAFIDSLEENSYNSHHFTRNSETTLTMINNVLHTPNKETKTQDISKSLETIKRSLQILSRKDIDNYILNTQEGTQLLEMSSNLQSVVEQMKRVAPISTKATLPDKCNEFPVMNSPQPDPNIGLNDALQEGSGEVPDSVTNSTTNWLEIIQQIVATTQGIVCDPRFTDIEDLIPAQVTRSSWSSILGMEKVGTKSLNPGGGEDFNITSLLTSSLASNPKILYAPNGTEADDIIEEVFNLLDVFNNIAEFAEVWLNISDPIKDVIEELINNRTADDDSSTFKFADQAEKEYQTINLEQFTIETVSDETTNGFNETTVPESITTPRPTRDLVTPLLQLLLVTLETLDWASCKYLEVTDVDLNFPSLFQGFKTEEELVDFATRGEEGVSVLAGLVFDTNPDGSIPNHVTYKIRQNATLSQTTKMVRDLIWTPAPDAQGMIYYINGFSFLQDMIDRSIINVVVNKTSADNTSTKITEPGIYIHQVPTPCYRQDDLLLILVEHIFPLALILSWVCVVAMLVRSIVYEKELRLKEVMKLMGLESSVHWVGWFITASVQMVFTMSVLALILSLGNILSYTNGFLLWLTLLVFGLNAILFAFLVSTFFNDSKIGAACAGIFYMLTYVPYMIVSILENAGYPQESWIKIITSFFSTTGIGLAAKYIQFYETSGEGLTFYTYRYSFIDGDDFSLAVMTGMSLCSSFVYFLLTWYIDNVKPGDYGIPKPWYFPFTKSYWSRQPANKKREEESYKGLENKDNSVNKEWFDDEPENALQAISIENMSKVFSNGKLAVKKLSLNLYEGQILSFLGHNGAGKTTTMSMLTGMLPVSSGKAYIYGKDIRSQMEEIRKDIGMCPQYNVLFESMTVEEHLRFYARLKGTPQHRISLEVDMMLTDTGLRDKREAPVNALSGGMKRKLSIGIAFISGSRTVILDEPTAGVDPWSRREIWDLILKYKEDRTIMLSTHHMDEADILGDRIAVISHGILRCCGSSLFLKSSLGEGYHLMLAKKMIKSIHPSRANDEDILIVEPESASEIKTQNNKPMLTKCAAHKVTFFVKSFVPSAYLKAETTHELHYILPVNEIRNGTCGPLFDALDKNLRRLDISGYGISDTSLEEVFLRVTAYTKRDQSAPISVVGNQGSINDDSGRNGSIQQGSETPRHKFGGSDRGRKSRRTNRSEKTRTEEPQEPLPYLKDSFGREITPDPVQRSDIRQRKLGSAIRNQYHRQQSVQVKRLTSLAPAVSGSNNPLLRSVSMDQSITEQNMKQRLSSTDSFDSVASGTSGSDTSVFVDEENERLSVNQGAGSYVVSGWRFPFVQLTTCLTKRFIFSIRNWKALVSQIVLPVLFVTIAMVVGILGGPTVENEPPLEMTTAMFANISKGLAHNHVPISDHGDTGTTFFARPDELVDTYNLPSGIGATCVLESALCNQSQTTDYQDSCYQAMSEFGISPPTYDINSVHYKYLKDKKSPNSFYSEDDLPYFPTCECYSDDRGLDCSEDNYRSPPNFLTVTQDVLQNITGQSENDYIYYTTDIYRLSRYGANTYGHVRQRVPYWTSVLPLGLDLLSIRNAAKAWVDSRGWHSVPTFINSVNNAILRANLPPSAGNPAAYGITTINHPFNGTSALGAGASLIFGAEFIIAIMVVIGFSFIPAGFMLFLVQERALKAKHLQFVSGLSPLIYWISNLIWDMFSYIFPAGACLIVIYAFGMAGFTAGDNFYAVAILLLLFGWSCVPLMYPATFLFKEASAAYVFLAVFNIFVGVSFLFVTFMLDYFRSDANLIEVSQTLTQIFIVFPTFALGRGLMDIVLTNTINEVNVLLGVDDVISPFSWEVTGRNYVAMICVGIGFYLLTILIEYNFFIKSKVLPDDAIAPVEDEDVDVAEERQRVEGGGAGSDLIKLTNLTKIYNTRGREKHLAVHKLCLGVPKGECFGMLGVNGAGKTTTFKMMTGDHNPTSGDAEICGYSVLKDLNKARRSLGYCPQFDALFGELTARQHLTLYAKLRGIPGHEVPEVVNWAIEKLELKQYADRPVETYSGGNKRKLSTAIALLGNPSVIFLDEPTAGMDPYAKRFLWDLILTLVEEGRCIVLTSHSMEECETLCTRLAIMVQGRFRCLGSVQHLKSKFGAGYTIQVIVKGPDYDADITQLIRFMGQHLPEIKIKERHHYLMEFEFKPGAVTLSYVFKTMERAREELPILDYSVSQNTLDNVFINFVKEQAGEEAGSLGGSTYHSTIRSRSRTPGKRGNNVQELALLAMMAAAPATSTQDGYRVKDPELVKLLQDMDTSELEEKFGTTFFLSTPM